MSLKPLKHRFWRASLALALVSCSQESASSTQKSASYLEPLPVVNPENLQVPDFVLSSTDGSTYRLYDLLDLGNYVLLNFWATWCPPCLEELPSMEDLNRRFKGKAFSMVAVSVDDQMSDISSFLNRLGSKEISFLVLHDPGKLVATGLYGTEMFPESFLIAPDKRLVAKYIGAKNWTSPETLVELEGVIGSKTQ